MMVVTHSRACAVSQPGFKLPTLPDGRVDTEAPSQCSCDFLDRMAQAMGAENTPEIAAPNSAAISGVSERYRRIPCPVDLCELAIEEAVHMGLPPAYVYELHVGERLATSARGLIQHHMAWKGPLAPLVNLHVDKTLRPLEWFIESNGVAIGCECI